MEIRPFRGSRLLLLRREVAFPEDRGELCKKVIRCEEQVACVLA